MEMNVDDYCHCTTTRHGCAEVSMGSDEGPLHSRWGHVRCRLSSTFFRKSVFVRFLFQGGTEVDGRYDVSGVVG